MRELLLVMAATCVLACGSQDPTVAATDAGVDVTGEEGGTDAPVDGAADAPKEVGTGCNDLVNVGAVVPQMFVTTDPVTGAGGSVVPGTYVLTAASVYVGPSGGSGPTGLTLQDTLSIAEGLLYRRVVVFGDDSGGAPKTVRQNGTFTVTGSSIKVTQTCPAGSQPFTSYDAVGAKIRIHAPAVGPNPALTFEYTKN